jgi:uncharacterized protein GlcG (DUF336 family)
MSLTVLSVLLAASVFGAAHAQTPGPPPAAPIGTPITLEQAVKAAEAAMAEAARINIPMAIAIVEPTGELVYFRKMNGAPYSAIQLAQGKAVTAARYRRPTKFFFDMVQGGQNFFMTFPGVLAVPGGLPIIADGKLIGAIGVSGGNAEQDTTVASPGANALK